MYRVTQDHTSTKQSLGVTESHQSLLNTNANLLTAQISLWGGKMKRHFLQPPRDNESSWKARQKSSGWKGVATQETVLPCSLQTHLIFSGVTRHNPTSASFSALAQYELADPPPHPTPFV